MSTEAPIPTEDQILQALNRTGFMFEQRVANVLGEDTSTGWAFKDQDTGVSREIDIYKSGYANIYDRRRSIDIRWIILGECKSYQWPWVVLTKPWGDFRYHLDSPELMTTLAAKIELGIDDEMIPVHKDEKTFSQTYGEVRFQKYPRAVQLVKLNKKSGGWEAHSGDIFSDITYPLAKAISLTKDQFEKKGTESEYWNRRREIQIVFPAIFISSPIYVVSAAASNPAVEQANHVVLERRLSSESVEGLFRYDLVHVDGIREWYNDHVLGVVWHFMKVLNVSPSGNTYSRGLEKI
jgi:hypothetical protein